MANVTHNLDERLLTAVDMVRTGSICADVGCDHAYLSIHLVENGVSNRVIACDLRKGPLESAAKNIKQRGLSDAIETRLCFGLDGISPDEAEDIIICGMGGITITEIIDRAAWLKDSSKHLVLQPMTHADVLRKHLCENGYEIIKEKACFSAGHVYTVMSVMYSGNLFTPDDTFALIGRLGYSTRSEKMYIERETTKLIRKNEGLKNASADNTERIKNNEKLIKYLKSLV